MLVHDHFLDAGYRGQRAGLHPRRVRLAIRMKTGCPKSWTRGGNPLPSSAGRRGSWSIPDLILRSERRTIFRRIRIFRSSIRRVRPIPSTRCGWTGGHRRRPCRHPGRRKLTRPAPAPPSTSSTSPFIRSWYSGGAGRIAGHRAVRLRPIESIGSGRFQFLPERHEPVSADGLDDVDQRSLLHPADVRETAWRAVPGVRRLQRQHYQSRTGRGE